MRERRAQARLRGRERPRSQGRKPAYANPCHEKARGEEPRVNRVPNSLDSRFRGNDGADNQDMSVKNQRRRRDNRPFPYNANTP